MPGGQAKHAAKVCPGAGLYDPAGQGTHESARAAASALLKRPDGQAAHAAEAGAAAKKPGVHSVQEVAPGAEENAPTGQAAHAALTLAPPAPTPRVPGGHGRHAVRSSDE